MPHLTLPITAGGPLLELAIGVSNSRQQALKKAGKKVPTAVRLRGLVDTGASCTCVDPDCIASLGLSPTGQAPMLTPSTDGTPKMTYQYDVSVVLLHPGLSRVFGDIPIAEARNLRQQNIDVLIGRDVLAECLFVYDGTGEQFMIGF